MLPTPKKIVGNKLRGSENKKSEQVKTCSDIWRRCRDLNSGAGLSRPTAFRVALVMTTSIPLRVYINSKDEFKANIKFY